MSEENVTNNIFGFEVYLKEKMDELKSKSKLLDETQQELLKVRQQLLNKEIDFEEQKRLVNDLQMQLSSSRQLIELMEKEKTKRVNEGIQSQINCNVALKERESLIEQAHVVKLENSTFKWNIEKLTENLISTETAKKELEETLLEMRDRLAQTHLTFQSTLTKLEEEQQMLLQSVESVTVLNKRLQAVGLCTHAIYTKKNEEIKELRKELVMKTQVNVPLETNQEYSSNSKIIKFDAKTYIEQLRLKMDNRAADDKEIEALLTEFDSDKSIQE